MEGEKKIACFAILPIDQAPDDICCDDIHILFEL